MTKMAATPIYEKSIKNLLQNQNSYGFETWHAASKFKLYNLVAYMFEWGNLLQSNLMGENLQEMKTNLIQKIYVYEKDLTLFTKKT